MKKKNRLAPLLKDAMFVLNRSKVKNTENTQKLCRSLSQTVRRSRRYMTVSREPVLHKRLRFWF